MKSCRQLVHSQTIHQQPTQHISFFIILSQFGRFSVSFRRTKRSAFKGTGLDRMSCIVYCVCCSCHEHINIGRETRKRDAEKEYGLCAKKCALSVHGSLNSTCYVSTVPIGNTVTMTIYALLLNHFLNLRMNGKRGNFQYNGHFSFVGECNGYRFSFSLRLVAFSIYSYFLCVIMVNIAWNVSPRMLTHCILFIIIMKVLNTRIAFGFRIRSECKSRCTTSGLYIWRCILNVRHVGYCIPNAICIEHWFFLCAKNSKSIPHSE